MWCPKKPGPAHSRYDGPAWRGALHHDRVHRRLKTWQHVYRTIAKEAGVDDLLASFLLGHSPTRISQRYLSMPVLRSGPAMRSAQRAVSKRIVALLGQA